MTGIDLDVDLSDKTVGFTLPKGLYSLEGLQIANEVLAARAEVYLSEGASRFEVTLKSKRAAIDEAGLRELAGEFANELLNQEYRFVVGRFNRKISDIIVTQALLSARGGEEPRKAPAGEETPEFKAAVEEMLAQAREEIAKTMPRKLPPQGTPLPPVREDAGV